jgi:hypothetical protein
MSTVPSGLISWPKSGKRSLASASGFMADRMPLSEGKRGQVLVRTLKGQKTKPDAVEA